MRFLRVLGLLCQERLRAAGPTGAEVGQRSLDSEELAEKMHLPVQPREGDAPPTPLLTSLPSMPELALGLAAGAQLEIYQARP